MNDNTFLKHVKKYLAIEEQIKAFKTDLEKEKAALIEELKNRNKEEETINDHKVSYKHFTRSGIDLEAIKKAIDITPYKTSTPYTKFSCK